MTMPTAQPLPRPASARLTGNLAAAGSNIVWAAGFPAAEALIDSWPRLSLVAGRFAMALLLLLPLVLLVEGWPRRVPWGRVLWIGGFGLGGTAILILSAQTVTDPVTVAVISSVSPLAATVIEWWKERRPLTRAFLWGLLASVVGGLIASAGGEAGTGNLLLGGLFAVGSAFLYSWSAYETARCLPGRSGLTQGMLTIAGGLLAMLLVVAVWGLLGREVAPAPEGLGALRFGQLAVYGMGGLALAQVLFMVGVQRIGVALTSFHLNIAPFYVMVIMLALGGTWSWMQVVGAVIVAAGVLVAQRPGAA